MWDTEKICKDVPLNRVKRWSFSLRELLKDPTGRDQFTRFLEKEYSGENLKYILNCYYKKIIFYIEFHLFVSDSGSRFN